MSFVGMLQKFVATVTPWFIREGNRGAFLQAAGFALDTVNETLDQGLRLGHPLDCESSALPIMSKDRGIRLYATEPEASKRVRLSQWWQLHRQRGSHIGEMRNLAPFFLPVRPLMRIVHRSGSGVVTWHTLETDGSYTVHRPDVANWDYDGVDTAWARWWCIIYRDVAMPWLDPAQWGLAEGTHETSWAATAPEADGTLSLPWWIWVECETEGRTAQTGPNTLRTGFGADVLRGFSRDGVEWGGLVEPWTENLVPDPTDLSAWADSGSPIVSSGVDPTGAISTCRLEDDGALDLDGKTQDLGAFSGLGTLSLWMLNEQDGTVADAQGFMRDGTGGSILSAELRQADNQWALFSDTDDFTSATLVAFLRPRRTTASSGHARFWGIQVEEGLYPTSFIGGTRAADRVSFFTWVAFPKRVAARLRWWPGYAHNEASGDHTLLYLGPNLHIVFEKATATIVATIGDETLVSDGLTFDRWAGLTIDFDFDATPRTMTVSGASGGNGTVEGSATPPPMPLFGSVGHVLSGPSGAEEAAAWRAFEPTEPLELTDLATYGDGTLWDGGPSTAQIDNIVGALLEAKAAHSALWGVLLTNDPDSFDPTSEPQTNPDGWTTLPTGNWWSSIDSTTGRPSRPPYVSWLYDRGKAS